MPDRVTLDLTLPCAPRAWPRSSTCTSPRLWSTAWTLSGCRESCRRSSRSTTCRRRGSTRTGQGAASQPGASASCLPPDAGRGRGCWQPAWLPQCRPPPRQTCLDSLAEASTSSRHRRVWPDPDLCSNPVSPAPVLVSQPRACVSSPVIVSQPCTCVSPCTPCIHHAKSVC